MGGGRGDRAHMVPPCPPCAYLLLICCTPFANVLLTMLPNPPFARMVRTIIDRHTDQTGVAGGVLSGGEMRGRSRRAWPIVQKFLS